MKNKRKLTSIILLVAMLFLTAMPAVAESETGSITINNAVVGQTYTIYKILDLESYDAASKAYAYKANSAWENWLETQTTYVSIDDQGYVTWVANASAADFAKAAQAYATGDNEIASVGSKDASAPTGDPDAKTTTVSFNNLALGYYLVDSTLGTLCSLDTTNPNVTMKEKNVEPINEKKVQEDSTNNYGGTNDAEIGQTVNFQSTITAQAGAQNYVFHDKMDAGLTYTGVTGITLNGATVDASNYTVTAPAADGDTFDVVFTQAFCDTLNANDKIVISYTATVNENAVVGGNGNSNTSKLSYGEEGQFATTPSETKTYTWDVDVFKYTTKTSGEEENVKTEEVALAGAKFTLSKNANGTDPIALVAEGNNVYRVAKTGETGITEITTDATGKFTIKGLDSDTYYLTETAAPAGYNKLANPIIIKIADNGNVTVGNETAVVNEVKVLNQTGTELPSTGGMGTTIFYVLGGVLVVGAGVLLVTKKRMSVEK